MKELKWYEFNQNNSGGSFVHEPENGISHYVWIKASSADRANRYADSIGIYFYGVLEDRDCECCGDRWYPVGDSDGVTTPTFSQYNFSWGECDNIFLHDSREETFETITKDTLKDAIKNGKIQIVEYEDETAALAKIASRK